MSIHQMGLIHFPQIWTPWATTQHTSRNFFSANHALPTGCLNQTLDSPPPSVLHDEVHALSD
nr:hypothetical protein [uncultured bacterium]